MNEPRPEAPALDDLDAMSVLAEPARRRLYEVVSEADHPVGRDEAAAGAGVGRSLAAYHLDRLAEVGLLEVEFGRPDGRGGPGAGRPAKLYRRAVRDFVVHAPPRDYSTLAEILLRAEERSPATRTEVEHAAHELGRELGRQSGSTGVEEVLRLRGYEPYDDEGTLRFNNCPFHALVDAHRNSVCTLNLALVEGIVDGAGDAGLRASLEPDRARCCVALHSSRGER
jgi:predicted ArsR family transcriptional regulator